MLELGILGGLVRIEERFFRLFYFPNDINQLEYLENLTILEVWSIVLSHDEGNQGRNREDETYCTLQQTPSLPCLLDSTQC